METYQMNDRPLLDRLTPASHRALLLWCVSYALNHRDEITPDDIETLRKGNKAQQKTAEVLTRFGLDLTRETAQ
jgi:hypothetical protein